MQTIQLKKFGSVLVSRPAGQEAFQAIRPALNPDETVRLDFDGVLTVTPSWFDEFLTRLADFTQGKVELLPTTNASVLAILPILSAQRHDFAAEVIKKSLRP